MYDIDSAKLCQLECCISDFKKWLSCNKLKLNDSKTEFMVLYPKRLCHKIDISNCLLSVGSAKIKPANIVRNLGSIFDKHMNMENNISSKIQSAYYQLHRISMAAHLGHDLTKYLYFVFPSK